MHLRNSSRADLALYVGRQLAHFFPDGRDDGGAIDRHLDQALVRLNHCINGVRMWRPDEFDYLHSSQYTIFLYYLANTIWRAEGDAGTAVCTKLFYLNKALNGFECFYDNELPKIFFIGHTVGIVLVRARYPDYLALYQNCTVGKNHGVGPEFEGGLVMYPGSAIIGGCKVGARSYIAQGVSLVNADSPGDCVVFSENGRPVFRKPKRDILADIFRL